MIFLYFVISVILLVTGNKGEVLYTLLAAFGVFCYKKNRLQIKIIVIGLCIVFIMIPTITTLRNTGVINSLGKISVSISDPLVEMGYQIRLSVFMIDGISNGSRSLLYGFSYYNPIVNIINRFIPMIPRISPPSQYDFFTTYDTMGFSQVAESYANYGVMGVVLFHIVIGVILAKFDNTNKNDPIMALNMCVLIVFIIMIRNAFNFVLGQILIAYILWMACMQLGAYTKIKHMKYKL